MNRVNVWIYDGDNMRPANQILYTKATKKGSGTWKTLKPSRGDVNILSCPCPAQPYDRMVDVTAVLNIDVGKGDESVPGYILAFIEINGTNCPPPRLDESSMEGATMFGRLSVPAGVAPNIKLQFAARNANMKYWISGGAGVAIWAETRPLKMDLEESVIIDTPDS